MSPPVTIDSIKDWFDTNSGSPVTIWCEDPETNKERIGGIMEKTYFTYRILMKEMGKDLVGVRHRYSEFEYLRNSIWSRYSILGIAVPGLPPKKQISSLLNTRADAMFVKERTYGLTLFCNAIVSIPFLRHDNEWKDFVKSSNAPSSAGTENMGETMLVAALSYLDIPVKQSMPQRIGILREEVNQVERICRSLLERLRALQSAERAVQAASEAFANTLQSWGDTESLMVKSIGGRPLDGGETNIIPEKEQTAYTLKALGRMYAQKHIAVDDIPDYEGVLLASTLEHELVRLDTLRELFKVHDEIVSSIDSLTAKLAKAETGRAGRAALEAVPELKLQLEEKHACLVAYYKGLMYFTLPYFARIRAQTLRKVAAYMGTSLLASSSAVQGHAVNFFVEMRLDPHDVSKNANHVLELLSVKPLGAIPINLPSGTLVAPLGNVDAFSGLFRMAIEGNKTPQADATNSTYGKLVTPSSVLSGSGINNNSSNNTYSNNNSNSNSGNNNNSNTTSYNSNNNNRNTSNYDFEDDNTTSPSSPLPVPPSPQSTAAPAPAPAPAPEPAPVVKFQATEKSKALLSDLMGSGSAEDTSKSVWD